MTVGTFRLTARTPAAATTARHALRAQLERWGCSRVEDGLLVFSELVTNAVRHAGGATEIRVVHGEQTLRFDVHDAGHDVPIPRDIAGVDGGFGLRIVEQLSAGWGWDQTDTGKVVWCAVPCCPDGPTGR